MVPTSCSYLLYTEEELQTLHRTFRRRHARELKILLERVNGSKIEKNVVHTVETMNEDCMVCKKMSTVPRIFKLTVGKSQMRFNFRVKVDTMFIQHRPVMHMADEATNVFAGSFFRKKAQNRSGTKFNICGLLST